MTLTPRDLELLGALCRAVRLFAWDQVRTWWPTPAGERLARRRLAALARVGLHALPNHTARERLQDYAKMSELSGDLAKAVDDAIAGFVNAITDHDAHKKR